MPDDRVENAVRLGCYAQRHAWARDAIERFLRSPSHELRRRAAPALLVLAATKPSVVEDLRGLCADLHPEVSEAGGYWLARLCACEHASLTVLKAELAGDAEVRIGAAAGLVEAAARCESAFDVLAVLACDTDGRVRAAAAESIGQAGRARPQVAIRRPSRRFTRLWRDRPLRAVGVLRDLLFFSAEPEEYIVQGAAAGLGHLLQASAPGALRLAEQLAFDPHGSRRWCAARALAGAMHVGRGFQPTAGRGRPALQLAALALDSAPMVRAEVAMTASALAAVDSPRPEGRGGGPQGLATQAACEILHRLAGDSDPLVRSAAAEATGRAASVCGDWAFERLGRFAAAADHNLRLGAAAGLAFAAGARPEAAGQLLCSLAHDKWAMVRAQATAGLARTWATSPQVRQTLLGLGQDSHPLVRGATARALAITVRNCQAAPRVLQTLDSLHRDGYIEVRRAAIATIGAVAALDPERALSMLAQHLDDEPAPEVAQAVACALAVCDVPQRIWAGVRIAVAARSVGFLRELADAAHDLVSADLMSAFADAAGSEPLEDHVGRIAGLLQPHADHDCVAVAWAAADSAAALLRARSLDELTRAYERLPAARELLKLLAFAAQPVDLEAVLRTLGSIATLRSGTSAFADIVGAYSCTPLPADEGVVAREGGSTSRDQAAQLEAVLQQLRPLRLVVDKSPSVTYRRVAGRVLEAACAVISAALPSLRDQPQVSVELLPARAYLDRHATVALRLRNVGRASAVNVCVRALAEVPYQVRIQDQAVLTELAPGEEAVLPLDLAGPQPLRESAATLVSASISYADAEGAERRADFACGLALEPMPEPEISPGGDNPYVPGKPLAADSPMFVGRSGIFAFLREALHGAYQENVIALIGPRRIGKTSILRQAERHLGDRYWPVFLDVQGILLRDVGSLWRGVAERCRDAVGAQLAVPSPAEFASDLAVLPRFLEGLTRAGGGHKRLLIMLDEFDDLEQKVRSGLLPDSVFAYLRHLIQHSPRIGFLLSGTNRLEELGQDYWSFLFNLAIYRKVGRLELGDAHHAITEPMASAGITCDELAAYRIWELSGGHPYLLQLVGHYLVSRCHRLNRAYLDYDAVDGCVGEIIEWSESHLRYLWEQCDPVEQAVLAAARGCGCGGMTAADVAAVMRSHGCELASARLGLALDALMEKDLVASAGQVTARCRPTMGILGAWIERLHPLPGVVRRAAQA